MDSGSLAVTDDRDRTSVRIYLPDERLQSFATFYYVVECRGPLEDFLYPEWGNVRFSLRGSWWVGSREARFTMPERASLFGPTDRAFKVRTHDGMTAGFGLSALGWQRFLRLPAEPYANRIVTLENQLGEHGDALHARVLDCPDDQAIVALFDRLLLDQLAVCPHNSVDAMTVDRVLRDRPVDAAAFAAAAGMTAKQLLRACKQVFGFPPKRLLRRQRFLDTLGRIRITPNPTFADLRDAEYFDQSHFNHEFHEFMGLSPKEYLSVERPLMGQAALVQVANGIPLSFKLPPQPDVAA